MGEEITEYLAEDLYRFVGQNLTVRSNSHHLLAYLRSMYGRFYLGSDDPARDHPSPREDTGRHTIEITDNLESSNELRFKDEYHLYRFSRNATLSRLSVQDLHAPDRRQSCFLEFYDPLTFVCSATLRTVSLSLSDHHLLHAGAVSLNDQGIILPAAPGMGKTTLVVKMVMLGCKFLSDEIACLSPASGLLEPFPRKVNIREPSRELLGLSQAKGTSPYPAVCGAWNWSMDIEDISPASLGSACKPRYMVFLRGFGDEPRLDRLARSNALFELLEYAVGRIEDPPRYLFRLAGLLNNIECYSLVVGDLDETVKVVMALAGRGMGQEG